MVDGLSRSLDMNSNKEVAADVVVDLTTLLSFVAVKCELVQQYRSQVS